MSADPGPPTTPGPEGASRDRRRDLAGIGFLLIGAWFAVTSYQLEASLVLRAVLVVLGLAVLGYGVAQLVRRRR